MRILLFFCSLLFLLFSLHAEAAEPTSAFTELHASKIQVGMSSLIDQAISDTFNGESINLDFQDVSEIDVDKIILPRAAYSLPILTGSSPIYYKNTYSALFSYWLDRPPLFA